MKWSICWQPPKPKTSAPNKPLAKADAQDPNEVNIDRTANVIQKFVREKSGGAVDIKFDAVKEIISKNVNAQDLPELSAAYAANLAGSIEKALYSQKVLALLPANKANSTDDANATSEAPTSNAAVQIINNFLAKYRERFAEIVANQRKEKMAAIQRRVDAKAAAMQSLYGSAGAFAMFMLVVFLSIFIKIERNLRPQT